MAQPSLKICFVIIGATPGGLALALSLRRAGHRAVVLQVEDAMEHVRSISSYAVPPNMSKLLTRWGLEKELDETSIRCKSMFIQHYERGEVLGEHKWHEELFKDAGGYFLDMHHNDLHRLLRDKAVSLGAEIIPDAQVLSIDFDANDRPSVRLASGDVLEADVVVGADGMGSIARTMVIGEERREIDLGLTSFNISVPREAVAADPQLEPLLDLSKVLYAWWGSSRFALGWVAGVHPEYFLRVLVPKAGTEEHHWRDVTRSQALTAIGHCEPRLQKLIELSSTIRCLPVTASEELETWIHSSGRMLILGDAAHPFPPGGVNEVSTSVCDAATLGELFRHLHSDHQITRFVQAFEELRQKHVKGLLEADLANFGVFSMPAGEAHEQRDVLVKEKYRAGVDAFMAFMGDEDDEVAAVWERDKDFLAYDAEDHAAEWWNDWGLLQERADRRMQVIESRVPRVLDIQKTATQGIEVR